MEENECRVYRYLGMHIKASKQVSVMTTTHHTTYTTGISHHYSNNEPIPSISSMLVTKLAQTLASVVKTIIS